MQTAFGIQIYRHSIRPPSCRHLAQCEQNSASQHDIFDSESCNIMKFTSISIGSCSVEKRGGDIRTDRQPQKMMSDVCVAQRRGPLRSRLVRLQKETATGVSEKSSMIQPVQKSLIMGPPDVSELPGEVRSRISLRNKLEAILEMAL